MSALQATAAPHTLDNVQSPPPSWATSGLPARGAVKVQKGSPPKASLARGPMRGPGGPPTPAGGLYCLTQHPRGQGMADALPLAAEGTVSPRWCRYRGRRRHKQAPNKKRAVSPRPAAVPGPRRSFYTLRVVDPGGVRGRF
ncbi:hypothetical protein GWK47_053688 [Chionoecetes opilio]|uniref:Uncharacterized protein n=1 Tax=Chionoecetes opilio TaxID=41210 RepID=A0A8J4XZC1_CHIOP|nr:hypothetical protein GWK47_053688 [Chionoecetes opilio]